LADIFFLIATDTKRISKSSSKQKYHGIGRGTKRSHHGEGTPITYALTTFFFTWISSISSYNFQCERYHKHRKSECEWHGYATSGGSSQASTYTHDY
jgi:hypothetical protein